MKTNREKYDLIIVGGGAAASFLCLSIFKLNPNFNILILEQSVTFPLKIGESLIDMTALFVQRLGIEHILTEQTTKTGIRFLFNESNSFDRADVAEFASPSYKGRIKSYHLNRSLFDQQLLDEVEKKGVHVIRPAEIIKNVHTEFDNQLDIQSNGEIHLVQSKWLIDASGRSRFIQRTMNWKDQKIGLNTGSVMAHFKNIAEADEWDTPMNKEWDTCAIGKRKFSTTHLMRKNRWWWIIRLDNETTSIGVVFDNNKVKFENPEEFFLAEIKNDAQLSRLLAKAEIGPIRHIESVPYVSERLYSKGMALIGESGAFIDPLISPGLELISQQALTLAELLIDDKKTNHFQAQKWEKYNALFLKAYAARLKMYEAGYNFIESYDLYTTWLKAGNVKYFSGVVYPSILFPKKFKKPLTFTRIEQLGVSFLIHRLKKIHTKRINEGRISATLPNTLKYSGVRIPNGAKFYIIPLKLIGKAISSYLRLELVELKSSFKKH